ncbi:MAG: peptide deformylase [Nitrospirae bacterium]|nr:peptide deformylase [Nitrospirota bacterium]
MAVLKIVTYPDPRLQQKSRPVEKWDKELYKLIEDMEHTLDAAPGLGLAAVQVGVSLQVFLYDENAGEEKSTKSYRAMINPEILFREGEIREEEGCLSIPDYRDTVVRAAVVRVKGFNKEGEPVEVIGEGLLARVFQHEIDHVNGILFINRLSSLKRGLFLRRMKKLQRQTKAELSGKV